MYDIHNTIRNHIRVAAKSWVNCYATISCTITRLKVGQYLLAASVFSAILQPSMVLA
jgi:hypothetical protein